MFGWAIAKKKIKFLAEKSGKKKFMHSQNKVRIKNPSKIDQQPHENSLYLHISLLI